MADVHSDQEKEKKTIASRHDDTLALQKACS